MRPPRRAAAAAASANASRVETLGIPPWSSTESNRPGAASASSRTGLAVAGRSAASSSSSADDVGLDHAVELAGQPARAPAVAVVLDDRRHRRAERGEGGGIRSQHVAVEADVRPHQRRVVEAIGSPEGETTSTLPPR